MSLDRLERATRALREATLHEAAGSNGPALARVLARSERPRPAPLRLSMRHVRLAACTLAMSLIGVGAWANMTGRVRWFAPEPASAPPAETAPPAAPISARPRSQPPAAPSEPAPLQPEPVQAAAPRAEPLAVAPSVSPPAASRRPPAARPAPVLREAPAPPDADALYRAAHQAHFGRADYAAALALWDRYLAEAEPGHRWKIEARYNRGIALYRLGQTELAREALEPFARGEYGAYRRADAQRLLETLPRSE